MQADRRRALALLLARWLAGALWLLATVATAQTPYTPADDRQALSAASPLRGLAATGAVLASTSFTADSAEQSLRLAEQALELGRARADPRWFGVAEAALQAWESVPTPPPAIQRLRAVLRQRRHDFAGALADLDALLRADPDDRQARLVRAVIHAVQGRPQQSQADCLRLIGASSLLLATTCLANARGLLGQAAPMLAALEGQLQSPAGLDAGAEERRWALTVAAELAVRLQRPALASRYYAEALALASREQVEDVYLQSSWADFQLAQGDAARVERGLRRTRSDLTLLRLAIAERRLAEAGQPAFQSRWQAHAEELDARFELARQRGESGHGREEALLALALRDDPLRALRHSERNWQLQREPADARLLLESAIAAGRPEAAEPVRAWLRSTGLEDPALRRLAGLEAP